MAPFHKGHRTRSLFLVTFGFTVIYIFESIYLYFQEHLFKLLRAVIFIFESIYLYFQEQLFLFSRAAIYIFEGSYLYFQEQRKYLFVLSKKRILLATF